MTNTPGDEPTRPEQQPRPSGDQPGSWQQQAQSQPRTPPQGTPPSQGQPYPQAPSGYPGHVPVQYAPDHPRAVTSLVLGILGIVLCGVLAPFAWSIGSKTLKEIDASNGMVGGRGAAQAGYILGIVGTVLLVIYAIAAVFYVIFMISLVGGGVTSRY
ncbi:MAG TPA: DUF4190 domain-containing protein [Nocardioidaceae bacterium]|nr:DUF4190 domain-containing protein [Nocardioidaceae bacterium]